MWGGSWGDTGQTGEIDYDGEIDFDISGITLESGGTSEGQVCGGGGSWGDTGQAGEIDYDGEIDFDISGITLESGGTSEGQVCGVANTLQPHYNAHHYNAVFNITQPFHGSQIDYFTVCLQKVRK